MFNSAANNLKTLRPCRFPLKLFSDLSFSTSSGRKVNSLVLPHPTWKLHGIQLIYPNFKGRNRLWIGCGSQNIHQIRHQEEENFEGKDMGIQDIFKKACVQNSPKRSMNVHGLKDQGHTKHKPRSRPAPFHSFRTIGCRYLQGAIQSYRLANLNRVVVFDDEDGTVFGPLRMY